MSASCVCSILGNLKFQIPWKLQMILSFEPEVSKLVLLTPEVFFSPFLFEISTPSLFVCMCVQVYVSVKVCLCECMRCLRLERGVRASGVTDSYELYFGSSGRGAIAL